MAVRKKKKVVARRSGVTGAPFAKGLDAVHSFFGDILCFPYNLVNSY